MFRRKYSSSVKRDEIFNRRLMISEPVIKRSEREITQWWWIGHDFEQALAVLDHFGNLETIPASFFFAKIASAAT